MSITAMNRRTLFQTLFGGIAASWIPIKQERPMADLVWSPDRKTILSIRSRFRSTQKHWDAVHREFLKDVQFYEGDQW